MAETKKVLEKKVLGPMVFSSSGIIGSSTTPLLDVVLDTLGRPRIGTERTGRPIGFFRYEPLEPITLAIGRTDAQDTIGVMNQSAAEKKSGTPTNIGSHSMAALPTPLSIAAVVRKKHAPPPEKPTKEKEKRENPQQAATRVILQATVKKLESALEEPLVLEEGPLPPQKKTQREVLEPPKFINPELVVNLRKLRATHRPLDRKGE